MYGTDTTESRRRAMLGAGTRYYSTSQWQPSGEEQLDAIEVALVKEEMEALLMKSTPKQALRNILWASKPGKEELAWQLYSASVDVTFSDDVLCDLLEYLGKADLTRTANRLLQVFERTAEDNRRSSSYRLAVNAYVALKMIGPAIQLLEEASVRFDPRKVGIDAVLQRTVQDDQWDLSLRVFKTFLRWADRGNSLVDSWQGYGYKHLEHWAQIFGQTQHVLEPVEHLRNFLDHMRQYHHELNATEENQRALHLFVRGYLPGVMWEVINTSDPDEEYIYNFFDGLFADLRALQVPVWALYEFVIPTFLEMPRYQRYSNQRKIFLDLYTQYRQEYLDAHCTPPSPILMHKLIIQHARHLSYARVDAMVDDLRSFFPSKPFDAVLLISLIRAYASAGLVDKVHEFFEILQTEHPSALNLRTIVSLPYAYARRIDVPGAIEQFKRITDEFHMVPDTACWNALLLAFTRADDLDGALECFNNCLESGIRPDLYTFGPMLDLCASRGDVEAFEALFSRAKQLGVPVEIDRHARSGYVEVFLNAGDPHGAEQIAQGILHSWKAGTLGKVEVTHVWNLLIGHYAVGGQLAESRRLYHEMGANGIPLDSWTYGALMRSLVESKNTNAAFKILRVTMPKNNVRVHAFHYALVISGYLRENKPQRANAAYNRMKHQHIQRTPSLRRMELLHTGMQDLLKLKAEKSKDPRAQLVRVEEELRKSLMSDYGHEIANDEPSLNRYVDSPELNNVPQSYFSMLILLYTARGAFDIAKQLFEKASKASTKDQDYSAPIALLSAIMETHFKAGDWDEVEQCWELARSEAGRLVKTFHQVMHPSPPSPEFDSVTDATVKERFETSHIAMNRRQILFRASRFYIRALIAQRKPELLQRAQRTVSSLLSNGFVVDSLTWNELIQALAKRHRVVDAFSACEMYLMPQFPGWAELSPFYIRHFHPSYSWMELRHHDLKRGTILPRYKTLVILAAEFARVRREEANGNGFSTDLNAWVREVLEKVAPETIRAIETMPRTGDYLQKTWLGDV